MGVVIREIKPTDAEAFLSLKKQLDEETRFMLFEPGERNSDIDTEEKRINTIKQDDLKEVFVLSDDELVGFIAVMGQNLNRIKHRASIVIGILQAYQGKGYGKELFKKAEEWAIERGIRRFELTVMTLNKNALWLYSSVGFNVEGIRRKALIVDGVYTDEFYMSKMF